MIGYLLRFFSGDEGTFGRLYFPENSWACETLELPWRENERQYSCIPAGDYKCVWRTASRSIGGRRTFYGLESVPGRDGILIHAGNYAGDTRMGWRADSYGCILLGARRGVLGKQRAVLASRTALNQLHIMLNEKPWTIQIRDFKNEYLG